MKTKNIGLLDKTKQDKKDFYYVFKTCAQKLSKIETNEDIIIYQFALLWRK